MTTARHRRSAGLLPYRRDPDGLRVLVAHMGGPLWARRDERAWSIPKGEHGGDEEPLAAARREFAEELGLPAPDGPTLDLGEVRQGSGKRVRAWAVAADVDPDAIVPGTFEMAWPPRSGRTIVVPEVDRVAWMTVDEARPRLVAAQEAFLDRLVEHLDGGAGRDAPS
ncbi:MAG: NUDIX domain-containing protein [Solirubrobacteraceae bacterium]|nr:NUDIX domain-containing protein [Solirubrobacteraceae bacterium]